MKRFILPALAMTVMVLLACLLHTPPTTAQQPTPAATGTVPSDTLAKVVDVLHQTSSERNQLIKIANQLQGKVQFLEALLDAQLRGTIPNARGNDNDPPPGPPDESGETKQTIDLTPTILKDNRT